MTSIYLPPRAIRAVKTLLIAKGWSQNELARQMGIDTGTLSKWLNRKAPIPHHQIINIAKAFSVDSWAILPREPEDSPVEIST